MQVTDNCCGDMAHKELEQHYRFCIVYYYSLDVQFKVKEVKLSEGEAEGLKGSFKFLAGILSVKSSVWGFKWQTTLVVLVSRTWHLYGWMHLNGSNIAPPFSSLACFLLLSLAISLLLYRRSWLPSKKADERMSLSSPLSISPHPSPFDSPCPCDFIYLPSSEQWTQPATCFYWV